MLRVQPRLVRHLAFLQENVWKLNMLRPEILTDIFAQPVICAGSTPAPIKMVVEQKMHRANGGNLKSVDGLPIVFWTQQFLDLGYREI